MTVLHPPVEQSHPDLVAEFHPHQISGIDPGALSPGSATAVRWKCRTCGHVWISRMSARAIQGYGCSVCAGKVVVPGVNDLASQRPDVAAQWHPTRNGDLTPDQVCHLSRRQAWWTCPDGHVFRMPVVQKKTVTTCRVCGLGRRPTNDQVSRLYAKARRAQNRSNWWKCPQGHRWQTPAAGGHVADRTICPTCGEATILPGPVSLATVFPTVAAQWHPTRNGDVSAAMVAPTSKMVAWWLCPDCGREWHQRADYLTRGRSGCPSCSGHDRHPSLGPDWNLQTMFPQIAADAQRGGTDPTTLTPYSSQPVRWRCEAGHEWVTSVHARTVDQTGCGWCGGKYATDTTSLQARFPDIASQWHPTLNGDLTPDRVRPRSNRQVWWKCPNPDCGHVWKTMVAHRTRGTGCPACARKTVTNRGVVDA